MDDTKTLSARDESGDVIIAEIAWGYVREAHVHIKLDVYSGLEGVELSAAGWRKFVAAVEETIASEGKTQLYVVDEFEE